MNTSRTTIKEEFNQLNHPSEVIPVVASFSPQGDVRPVYIGLCLEDGTTERVRVENVISTKRYINTIIFQCEVVLSDMRHTIEIGYFTRETTWKILHPQNRKK